MNIKHYPLFNTENVCELYSEKDGVSVTYVCTTDLVASDVPVDVYYRETPHPQFGNRYFGLYYDIVRDCTMITNADIVETLVFGLVENDEGELEYSQSHHNYKIFKNGNMIDGGRQYIRTTGADVYKIRDGEFYEVSAENTSRTNEQDYIYPGSDPQE
jgi:hypothetical protein